MNISGQQVATGVGDPSIMFAMVGALLVIAVVVGAGWAIYQMFN
jgi:hypothetical protein